MYEGEANYKMSHPQAAPIPHV